MKRPPLAAHLDLKGISYRPEYYETYFHHLQRLGYDAVVVEYEDTFPFQSASLESPFGKPWPADFLRQFLEMAAAAKVEVIPLQQCLGHLEYAFRRQENRCFSVPNGELRDLNVLLPQAREWMKKLLVEMLEAHPASRWIHLGMDEAAGFATQAKASGQEPLSLFLDYLEELCVVCERHEKTPMIWSDMLEDHIAPENLDRLLSLRDRVNLVPWNYAAGIRPESVVRFSGFRCSRQWLDNASGAPEHVSPPRDNLLFFDEWEPEIKRLTADFHVSPWLMEPLFQAAVWKRLGFTVWGGAGGSTTQDRSVLPYYNWRAKNIRQWKQTVERYQLDGLIVTQWARSNSCTVPNIVPDAVWPLLAIAADENGSASGFFPEIRQIDDLLFRIGKCREEWDIEEALIEEMSRQPVPAQEAEWKTLLLLLQLLRLHKGVAHREEQIGCYAGIGRLNEKAWKQHRDDLDRLRKELFELRVQARALLEARYQETALEEWFYKVFSIPLETVERLEASIEQSISLFRERQGGLDFKAR